jgi:hypothetical protein
MFPVFVVSLHLEESAVTLFPDKPIPLDGDIFVLALRIPQKFKSMV